MPRYQITVTTEVLAENEADAYRKLTRYNSDAHYSRCQQLESIPEIRTRDADIITLLPNEPIRKLPPSLKKPS